MMNRTFTAAELRTWAAQCARSANDPTMTAGDRERLLKMKTALLELARTTDWLNGKSTSATVEVVISEDGPTAEP